MCVIPSDSRIVESLRMLKAFLSVGCKQFDLLQTDVAQEKLEPYRAGRNEGAMRLLLPFLVPRCWKLHQNLIIRPRPPHGAVLAQLDDLDAGQLERVRSRAFLLLETSPGNYQAWFCIEGGDDNLVRRLVRGLGVDWNASRAVRVAGSPNCKLKYAPDFPMVKIAAVQFGRNVWPRELGDLVAAAAAAPVRAPVRPPAYNKIVISMRGWPDYERCLHGAPRKKDGNPDRSAADFMWSKWALERGHSVEAVIGKLAEVSGKAQQELKRGNPGYSRQTVEKAAGQ